MTKPRGNVIGNTPTCDLTGSILKCHYIRETVETPSLPHTAPAILYVQGQLINTEEALDSLDWNPMCVHSIWTPLLTLNWYIVACIITTCKCTVIIVYHIFTTDNFVKHKQCSLDIVVAYSGYVNRALVWCNLERTGV